MFSEARNREVFNFIKTNILYFIFPALDPATLRFLIDTRSSEH